MFTTVGLSIFQNSRPLICMTYDAFSYERICPKIRRKKGHTGLENVRSYLGGFNDISPDRVYMYSTIEYGEKEESYGPECDDNDCNFRDNVEQRIPVDNEQTAVEEEHTEFNGSISECHHDLNGPGDLIQMVSTARWRRTMSDFSS